MFDLSRLNPINLLIYGGTKLAYNQLTKEPKKKPTTNVDKVTLYKMLYNQRNK